jgi:predicted acylesterase/phospholipase RssA
MMIKRRKDMETRNNQLKDLLAKANAIRRGKKVDPHDSFKLAKKLAKFNRFDYAQRLAEHIKDEKPPPDIAEELYQKCALWMSKNPDLPDDSKHDEALKVLDDIKNLQGKESLETTSNPETLGIGGGICKRRWFIDGRRQSLEQSLKYYERGTAAGIESDNGYTAINAAFVHDLLASLDDPNFRPPTKAAEEYRKQVIDTLVPIEDKPTYNGGPPRREERWFHETIAEAYFGLRQFQEAADRLNKVKWEDVEPWEIETTVRQFAWLARLFEPEAKTSEDFKDSEAWGVLNRSFGDKIPHGAMSLFSGKLGLALSGGGFRASFFHIGVLAALAELDALRHVEVLSCVSGGSIVGAYYYLEIRKLLQENEDGTISREKYIQIVDRIAKGFLSGVQKNIRTRVAENIWVNLKMMLLPGYTRTERLGELYEKYLYEHIYDQDPRGCRERRLRKLTVRPLRDEKCHPKYDNWRRADKVPILILNATTLNTGHNWQFTSTWMGEPPSQIDSKVDGNYRLRRMYLENEAPSNHRDISIGKAVAASSCVPGLFSPLELRNLYEGITVRLVDGGVNDNQGIFGLIDQNCSVFVVSDASGQMAADNNPGDGPISVLLRSSNISMGRVRTNQFRELESRRGSGRLKGMLFLHLKRDLEVQDKDWIGCDNPKALSAKKLRKLLQSLTTYGIIKSFQEKIANIRTDLDSFSETEAYALMTSGCNMVRESFAKEIRGFNTIGKQHNWEFIDRIQTHLERGQGRVAQRIADLLTAASSSAFKIWKISRLLKTITYAAGFLGLVGLAWIVYKSQGLASVAATIVLLTLAGVILLPLIAKYLRYRKTFIQILIGFVLSTIGILAAWIHLLIFDKWFLKRGETRPN